VRAVEAFLKFISINNNIMALIGSDENKIQRAKTRVLLVLWAIAGIDNSLGKGKILPLTRTKEKAADYDEVFAALEADGAIALTRQKGGKIKNVTLTQVGYGLLGDWLRSLGFEGKQIGAKMGEYLVKWIREGLDSEARPIGDILVNFEEFIHQFQEVYLIERKAQEVSGASVIYKKDICEKFLNRNPISQRLLDEYYNKLKTSGSILTVLGRDGDEMIQWVD
jgi:hypothetical protein